MVAHTRLGVMVRRLGGLLGAAAVTVVALGGCASSQDEAKETAGELGMPLWLPAGVEIGAPGSYDPVGEVEEPQRGLYVTYEGYEVYEWPATAEIKADELDPWVLLPEPPADADTEVVVDEAADLEFEGRPARRVVFHEVMGGGQKVTQTSAVFVFQFDGVVARLSSGVDQLGADQLISVAETFEPVE
ncbi:MAG: hypothetical protein WCA30_11660 [Dermatophilaceae bacterium]